MNDNTTTRWIHRTVLLAGLLAGCAAGPDFKRPETPGVGAYTPTPLP
ncbi:MAG: hypothetical protein IH628_06425, partial [Proteobacteria bacterium]|nr:hypothetical protein [Pseudomonadota bacterium]